MPREIDSPEINAPEINRRTFLQTTATTMAAAATAGVLTPAPTQAGVNTGRITKAVKFQMFKEDISVVEKFQILKDLGYDGIEVARREKIDPREFVKAREKTGLPIHGVVNSNNTDLVGAVDLAKMYGGTSVLYVAGRVNESKRYDVNYQETQAIIRQALPHAEKAGVRILVENVWNNFLLSPLEMARYIDELESPAAGVYFDVGNVVRFGWPDQWIQILGSRIGKLDIKEYSRKLQVDEGLWKGFNVEIGEGDCDWPNVRQALADIKYTGWATAEVRGGDRHRMEEIAKRMDKALDL